MSNGKSPTPTSKFLFFPVSILLHLTYKTPLNCIGLLILYKYTYFSRYVFLGKIKSAKKRNALSFVIKV